jgi:hypothetical protein
MHLAINVTQMPTSCDRTRSRPSRSSSASSDGVEFGLAERLDLAELNPPRSAVRRATSSNAGATA